MPDDYNTDGLQGQPSYPEDAPEDFANIKLAALRDELKRLIEKSKTDDLELAKLRDENNKYRLLMYSDTGNLAAPDQLYIARMRNQWATLPIEEVLLRLELFQLHTQVYAEIAAERRGKTAIKDLLNARDRAKVSEAEEYRKAAGIRRTVDPLAKAKPLYSADKAENKAIAAYVKMGLDKDKAIALVREATGKASR